MKRKLHPHRRHGRHHVSAIQRHQARCAGYFGPFRKTPRAPLARMFPRVVGAINLSSLLHAGYPAASLESATDWETAHSWLEAHCTNSYGSEFTWFGGTFVFSRDTHHAAFRKTFRCAAGYKPMFAYETLTVV